MINKKTAAVSLFLCIISMRLTMAQMKDLNTMELPYRATAEQMQWFRDAKFGMFIHWGPVSLTGGELSWCRDAGRPFDIEGGKSLSELGNWQGVSVPKEHYDNLYKQFDPVQFDANKWVQIAKNAGMKYIVFTAKHHDGFSNFFTTYSEYSIANTPFKRDIVKELADACHRGGLKFGVYYSPRDWYHPDYLKGDNSDYNRFMTGQLRELLTNYGKIDILWFDSVGESDLKNDWRIPELIGMIRQLQPGILINNRLAVLNRYNEGPREYWGDFDTPEQKVGQYQIDRPWESCITLVGGQWSWKPGGDMFSSKECIEKLVLCACGDGNLLLNVGPMPTGQIEARQADRLKEMGDWLSKYGSTVYGTRGGPFTPGKWGGSTQKGSLIYLHIINWPEQTLTLPSLNFKITAGRNVTGGKVEYRQTKDSIEIVVPQADRNAIDTIIELQAEGLSSGKDAMPQTVTELYSDIDPRKDPLEVQVVREWDSDGIHYKYVRYLIASWKGKKSVMSAYYAYPEGAGNLPAVLHLHGGGQRAFLHEVTAYAQRGYAALSINWGGKDMGESVNTDWGAIDPTQKVPRYENLLPHPESIDDVESPRNCSWYPIVVAAQRALTFLEQQPEVDPNRLGVYGHSMGGSLTTFVAGTDSRVKAAVPSVGGAGYLTEDAYDLPNTARQVQGDIEWYRRTMEMQYYTPLIRCPILFLGATNDFNSKMDDVYRAWALIHPEIPQRWTFAPHFNHRFTPTAEICRSLWFDQYLKGTFTFPRKPASALSLTEADHIPLFEVTPDASQPIVAVDLYYSHDKDAVSRFWRDAQGVQVGNTWVARCPIMDTTDPVFNYLFTFANVTYRAADGTLFTISSDIHAATTAMLQAAGIAATDAPSMMIDDFSRGFHDWYRVNSDHPTLVEFWTHKITDPKWQGPSGAKLKLRVKSTENNQIKITLIENQWRHYRGPKKAFTKTVSVSASPDWQDVILQMSDFSGLTQWNQLDELGITPGGGSWSCTPVFSEFSWILN